MTIHAQLSSLQEIMNLPPSEDLMNEVERICAGESACKLFWCERLKNPAWFPLMVRRSWFATAPNISREGAVIVHPGWVESIVLLKFAKLLPTDVATVLASIPSCDNPRVGDQIIRISAEFGKVQDIRIVRERVSAILEDRTRSERLWLLDMLGNWLDAGAAEEVIELLP